MRASDTLKPLPENIRMKRLSKRQMVLEIYDREAMGEVTPREIAIINQALLEEFGEGGTLSPAGIARILADEDIPVRFDQVLAMIPSANPWQWLCDEVMRCKTLEEAETAICNLNAQEQSFRRRQNRAGLRAVHEAAIAGRQQALAYASQAAADSPEQKLFQEIAQWLTVWLQNPDVFATWLELRKGSPEFRQQRKLQKSEE